MAASKPSRPIEARPAASARDLRLLVRAQRKELERTLSELARSTDALEANRQFRALLVGRQRLLLYGPWNQLLILHQRRSATWVLGPRQWERLGRRTKPGAEPIFILAPSRPGRPWPFKAVEVYDVAQTRGPRLPALDGPVSGRATAQQLARLETAARRLGIELVELPELGFAFGGEILGQARGGRIELRAGLAPAARARVLAHELAHELLHLDRSQRGPRGERLGSHALCETEADAAAFLVLSTLGLRYPCPAYVVWQGGGGRLIARSFDRILAAARAICAAMEGRAAGPVPRLPGATPTARSSVCHPSRRAPPRLALPAAPA